MADISKFPNLSRYFNHFEDTDGAPERKDSLPYLIIWIRLLVEPEDDEWLCAPEVFELSDEDAEEFYSWGSNSRWKNVFWDFIANNLDDVKEKCIELAEQYGDPSVEEYLEGIGKE